MLPQPVEKIILPALQAAPGLTKLVGQRIYAHELPPGFELPALIYRRISGEPDLTLRGHQTSMVRMAFDAWAMEYALAKDIALEVQKALSAAPLPIWPEINHELSFNGRYRVTFEYTCQEKGGFEK